MQQQQQNYQELEGKVNENQMSSSEMPNRQIQSQYPRTENNSNEKEVDRLADNQTIFCDSSSEQIIDSNLSGSKKLLRFTFIGKSREECSSRASSSTNCQSFLHQSQMEQRNENSEGERNQLVSYQEATSQGYMINENQQATFISDGAVDVNGELWGDNNRHYDPLLGSLNCIENNPLNSSFSDYPLSQTEQHFFGEYSSEVTISQDSIALATASTDNKRNELDNSCDIANQYQISNELFDQFLGLPDEEYINSALQETQVTLSSTSCPSSTDSQSSKNFQTGDLSNAGSVQESNSTEGNLDSSRQFEDHDLNSTVKAVNRSNFEQ